MVLSSTAVIKVIICLLTIQRHRGARPHYYDAAEMTRHLERGGADWCAVKVKRLQLNADKTELAAGYLRGLTLQSTGCST